MRTLTSSSVLMLALAMQVGCSNHAMMSSDMGVTQGGAQDIGLARDIIEAGGIPDQSAFTAEGLFSEHDLPIEGEACADILCPRAAAAMVQSVDQAGEALLVQLGFATALDAETFERRPLNVAVVVDVSGSMSDGKLDAVKAALDTMVDQLDGNDTMTLVAFDDSADLLQESIVMDSVGIEHMRAAISDLRTRGGTNIEAGMELGYEQIAPAAGAPGVEDRLMLFTDAQPNIGATDVNSFLGMARYYAAAGIGISVFGTGLDLGTELATEISETRGGSYHYLADVDTIERVFDDEFDYIVSPVAYDLDVQVETREDWTFAEAFGAPMDDEERAVSFGASTLFLSARSGGMGVTLVPSYTGLESGETEPEDGAAASEVITVGQTVATFDLVYTPATESEPVSAQLDVTWQGGETYAVETAQADDLGVFKMAGLIDEYLAMTAAADACDGLLSFDRATVVVLDAADRLDAQSAALEDDAPASAAALGTEVALMDQLALNLEGGDSACR